MKKIWKISFNELGLLGLFWYAIYILYFKMKKKRII